MKTTITIIFTLFTGSAFAVSKPISRSTASLHARELMGKRFKKSIVSTHVEKEDFTKDIHSLVESRLPKKYKGQSEDISKAIIEESAKYSLDPYFVMAVISGESSFNPLAIGPVGEIGMMQIRTSTGKWMAEIIKLKWRGEKTLRDPLTNIKLGVAYLSWLRTKFAGHGQLYVAAYNMGPKAVKTAVARDIYPKDYPIHVMKRYIAFYKEIGKRKI